MIALNKAIQGWQILYKNTVLEVSLFKVYVWDNSKIEMWSLDKTAGQFN